MAEIRMSYERLSQLVAECREDLATVRTWPASQNRRAWEDTLLVRLRGLEEKQSLRRPRGRARLGFDNLFAPKHARRSEPEPEADTPIVRGDPAEVRPD